MLPRKLFRNLAIIAAILSLPACSSPAATQPVMIEPQVLSIPAEPNATPANQPAPSATPPSPTATPRPTPTSTSTPAAPSRMNLPKLTDARGSVIASGLGGGPLCDNYYQGAPLAHGAANSWVPARTGYLCIYGYNFDRNLHIDLTVPDNSGSLSGDFYVSSQDLDVSGNGFDLRNFGSNASWLGGVDPGGIRIIGEAYTRTFLKIRWRGDQPDGTWHIRVSGDNDVIEGDFYVIPPEYPSLTVLDSRWDMLQPGVSNCFLANHPQDLSLLAEGYPANTQVYIYIYEQEDGLVLQTAFTTDPLGSFYQNIPGPYRQEGKYFVIGALAPLSGPELPPGNLVDCFYVP